MRYIKVLIIILLGFTLSSCNGDDPKVSSINLATNSIEYQIDSDNFNNVMLEVTYSDGETELIELTKDMFIELEQLNIVGYHSLDFTYEGKSDTVIVKVYETDLDLELLGIYELGVNQIDMTYQEWVDSIRGVGIKTVVLNDSGHLIVTYTDDTSVDVGNVMDATGNIGPAGDVGDTGPKGEDGDDGIDGRELYKIEFLLGDEYMETLYFKEGEQVVFPDFGSSFIIEGWYIDSLFQTDYAVSTMPANDMILYGQYSRYDYAVRGDDDEYYSVITGYEGNQENITLPTHFEQVPLRIIDISSFSETNLVSVTIPDGVHTIQAYAFKNATDLETVVMTDSIVYIGIGAFEGCESLSNINLSTQLSVIEYDTFNGATSLLEITLPDQLIEIRARAFRHSSLNGVTFPDSVEYIGDYAFEGTNMVNLYVPLFVLDIGTQAFGSCLELETVVIDSLGVGYYSNWFFNTPALEELSVPNSAILTTIDDVLYGNNGASLDLYPAAKTGTTYTMPDIVNSITRYAFYDNQYLETIAFNDDQINLHFESFVGMKSLEEFVVTQTGENEYKSVDGVLMSYNEATIYSYPINKPETTYVMPSTVMVINNFAFAGNKNLETITFSSNISTIGMSAFRELQSVTTLTIPISINNIHPYAFYDSDSITHITIEGDIDDVSSYTFAEMDSLVNVTFSQGFEALGDYVFKNAISMTTFDFPIDANFLGTGVFDGCINLAAFTSNPLNPVIQTIDGVMYSGDQLGIYPPGKIDTVYEVEVGTTLINYHAFSNNPYIEEIILTSSITYLNHYAFNNLPNLTRITSPHKFNLAPTMFDDTFMELPLVEFHVHPAMISMWIGSLPEHLSINVYPIPDIDTYFLP